MDGRLQLNAAAFIANYRDYQVNQFIDLGFDEATGAQLTSIRISNAAEVDTNGFEFEATFMGQTMKLVTFQDQSGEQRLGILHSGNDQIAELAKAQESLHGKSNLEPPPFPRISRSPSSSLVLIYFERLIISQKFRVIPDHISTAFIQKHDLCQVFVY